MRYRRSSSLICRALEGSTTGGMIIGAYLSSADVTMLVSHALHWVASFVFHVVPSEITLFHDVAWIELLTLERFAQTHAGLVLVPIVPYMFSTDLSIEKKQKRSQLNAILSYGISVSIRGLEVIPQIMFASIALAIFHFSPSHVSWHATLFCCLFHITLGCATYFEILHNERYEQRLTLGVLRAMCLLKYVYDSIGFHYAKKKINQIDK